MPTIPKLRRTWFALLREAGVADDDRHWLQEALTGKPSTREWGARDFARAIASLQRDLGQHNDGHAHVREDRPRGLAAEPGEWCTAPQARTIDHLIAAVEWKVGPVAYLCRWMLQGDEKALRRKRLRRAQKDGAEGVELWKLLTRREAAYFIRALIKMEHVYPVGGRT